MQGPFDDTLDDDHISQKNTVPSQSENKFGKHYMSHKARMRGDSGACNVCAAPCSSCMHLNQALMASKTDEFSDETCRVNVASQHSVNGGDTLSCFKSKTCDSLQHTTSETSNLMSVSSSHDSLSENADSKAALRSSNDTLDIETLPLSSGGTTKVGSSPKPHRNLYPGGFSNKYEDSKVIDAHDDDISCVSRANDAYVVVSNSSRNVDRKNMPCSSVSVSSLGPEESKKGHESILCDMPPSKDADASSGSPKEKLCESSPEQIGASSKEGAAIDGASSPKSVAHTSDVPSKFAPKLEAEINNDGLGSTDGSLKCSGPSEQDEKPSKLDKQEPPLQSMSGDESDESDIVEHDVKVCDICGDAGREDLLAICSRCSDGAEHTYCMRKMLRKVPGSNWMCEECKFAEEVNSQKHEMEGKKTYKASSSTQLSTKRLAENIEVAPASKRQALESIGSPKSSSPIRMAALSRESSFKNLDKERLRSAHQISVGNQSTNDMLENARSLVDGQRLQNKGTLFKSNSFNTSNSKPKVKLVDEFVPQRQKGGKEYESLDMKDRSARMIRKSMSFKSANSGRSSSSDSKVKMLSPRLALAIDAKGSKQGKERTAFERKSLSRLDRPPISSTTSSSVSTPKVDQTSRVESTSFVSNNRDLKIQSEGKSSTSKSTLNLARKPVETPITTAGASLVGGMCDTAIEQKSNHAVSKDEALSTGSLATERPSNSVDGTSQDGTRWQEIMHQTEKTKESYVRSRPTVLTSSKSTFCQKCKEIGHSAEFCMSGSSESSGIDVSAARGSREETQRGSKLKDAIHAALLRKPEIQRKKRALDQSEELSTSSTDLNSEITCQDQALVSNKSKIIVSSEGIHEEPQAIPGSSTSDSMQTTVNNTMQHTVSTTNAKFSAIVGDLDTLVPSGVTPVAKDVMNHALVTPPQLLKMSAIPEYEYIWRGSFEVRRSGNFLDLCGGIQAHLSTCASPRVPEVVRNFPQKLSLIEVPRLSAWPAQFCDGGAKEDNIALYFFAKDLESYERNYKSLLDDMIKNDLALKGNLDGVELLIFPSNQLPENSQRWNMLFFLWGVFRARVHCSDSLKKLHIPSISMTLVDKNASNTDMTLSENLSSAKRVDEESSDDRSCNAIVASTAPDHTCDRISEDGNDQKLSESLTSGLTANSVWHDSKCDSKCTSNVNLLEKMRSTSPSFREKSPPEHMPRAELKPSLEVTGANSNTVEKRQLHCDTSVVRKDNSSLKVLPYANEDIGVRGNVSKEKIVDAIVSAAASFCDNRALDEINRGRDQYQHERDLSIKRIEHCQSTERKRPHIAVSDGASPASNVMAQNISWNGVNKVLVDGENFGKKQKTDQVETYVGSSYNSGTSIGGVEPKQKDVGSFLSVEEKICIEPCEEKIIPEDLGTTTERRFFPVDSRQGNNSSTPPWKSLSVGGDDERLLDGPPNLELALGAETKPQQNKGILPFLVGLVDNKRNQEKPQDKAVDGKEEDDEDSASLSLSLSFPPFPGNGQPVKPASKSEQLRPERHHVNTSLLLFGSFSDK